LMFVRKFLRRYLQWLRDDQKWDSSVVDSTLLIWQNQCAVIGAASSGSDDNCPDGLKMHWASIYLDELDSVGGSSLCYADVMKFLSIYIDLISAKSCGDSVFDCVIKEVFEAILLQFSAQLQPVEEVAAESDSQINLLKLDYLEIANRLLASGKDKHVNLVRRKIIFGLVLKFKMCAAGEDPCEEFVSSGSELELSDAEIENAARKILPAGKRSKISKSKPRPNKRLKPDQEKPDHLQNNVKNVNSRKQSKKPKKLKTPAIELPEIDSLENSQIISDNSARKTRATVSRSNRNENQVDRYFKDDFASPTEIVVKNKGRKNFKPKDFLALKRRRLPKQQNVKNNTKESNAAIEEKLDKFLRNPPMFAKKAVAKFRKSRPL